MRAFLLLFFIGFGFNLSADLITFVEGEKEIFVYRTYGQGAKVFLEVSLYPDKETLTRDLRLVLDRTKISGGQGFRSEWKKDFKSVRQEELDYQSWSKGFIEKIADSSLLLSEKADLLRRIGEQNSMGQFKLGRSGFSLTQLHDRAAMEKEISGRAKKAKQIFEKRLIADPGIPQEVSREYLAVFRAWLYNQGAAEFLLANTYASALFDSAPHFNTDILGEYDSRAKTLLPELKHEVLAKIISSHRGMRESLLPFIAVEIFKERLPENAREVTYTPGQDPVTKFEDL